MFAREKKSLPIFLHRYLLELLEEELGKPATSLYPHNLAGVLETAIRATNAQFEDPEILERLDVRLLDISPGKPKVVHVA